MDELKALVLELKELIAVLKQGKQEPQPNQFPDKLEVRPNGVLGQGKVRYWPKPITVRRMDGSYGMELCWSYALRMTYLKDENGEPLVPGIYRQQIGAWMQMQAPGPDQPHLYAAAVDRWVYPEDWYDQKEIDRRKAADADWATEYHNRYGV